ncbi:GtrA family protein [Planctomycetota bacterium]
MKSFYDGWVIGVRERFSATHVKVLKFVVSGGLNSALSLAIYWILALFLPYRLAYTIAYICGICISYVLQAKWVFRGRMTLRHVAFPMVYLVQYVLGIGLLSLLVELLAVPQSLAPLLVIVATLPVTFCLSRSVLEPRHES